MARRTAIFALKSDHTDPAFVHGANGPWGTTEIEDALYRYYLYKLNSAYPDKYDIYPPHNREFRHVADSGASSHFHVVLLRANYDHDNQRAITKHKGVFAFKFYSRFMSVANLEGPADTLADFVDQADLIFMRFPSNSIAGIYEIDHMTVEETNPPESEYNPFQDVFMRRVTIEVYWSTNFTYATERDWEKNTYGSRYAAGTIVEIAEEGQP